MPDESHNLIRKAAAGDTDALSALLREHGPAVEKSLHIDRTWQGVLDPADVMQVTYLDAFFRIKSFDAAANTPFAAWLRRIAENNLKDAIRGLTRLKRPSPANQIVPGNLEDSMVGLYDLLGMTTTTGSRQVARQELCTLLDNAISDLPDDYSRVIRMYDLEGMAIGEVAKSMGRSTGAVHMLRARAHEQLRVSLGSASIFFDSQGA